MASLSALDQCEKEIFVCVCVYIYLYVCTSSERERQRERERAKLAQVLHPLLGGLLPPWHRWERRGVGPGVYPLGELPLFFPAVLESHARRICPQVAPSVRVACAAIEVRQHREVCALRAPRYCGRPWCATIPDGIPPEP